MQKIAIAMALLLETGLEGQTPGVGSTTASQAAVDTSWQNWAFAGSSLVAVVTGILVVSMANGKSSNAH